LLKRKADQEAKRGKYVKQEKMARDTKKFQHDAKKMY
jgi:hypothetical protein